MLREEVRGGISDGKIHRNRAQTSSAVRYFALRFIHPREPSKTPL
jgi:hypothetical protein